MIGLARRHAGAPASLRAGKRVEKERILFERAAARPVLAFDKAFWKGRNYWSAAKKTLRAEAADKCAYCEASTAVVAHGDVEHFRPKSVYWWLAYAYDNYTFACQICNQTHKRDAFPLAAARLAEPTMAGGWLAGGFGFDPGDPAGLVAFGAAATAEMALLADPYADDIVALFAWKADDVLKEVDVVPRAKSGFARNKAETTIATLGLNRPELVAARHAVLTFVQTVVKALDLVLPEDRRGLVSEILSTIEADPPFKGMLRYFAAEVWKLARPAATGRT